MSRSVPKVTMLQKEQSPYSPNASFSVLGVKEIQLLFRIVLSVVRYAVLFYRTIADIA